MLTALRHSRFILDFFALLSSRAATQVLTVLVGLLLVRVMADPVFGAYSLATTSIGLAGVVADFGLDVILTREIAADRELALPLTRDAINLRLALAAITTIVLMGLALVTQTAGRVDLLLIGGLSLAPRGAMRSMAAALTGLGRVRETAVIEGINAVGTSIATVILVLAGFGVLGDRATAAIWGLIVGNVLGLIAAVWIARLRLGNVAGSGTWKLLLWAAVPFMMVGLSGALFQSLDIYIIKGYYWRPGTPDAVALYAAPFRVLNALLLVPTAWGVVALPRYVRYIRRPELMRLVLRRDLLIGLAGGLALSVACTLFAYPLTTLALGPTYIASVPILALVGWMTLPVCLSAPLIAFLTATGHQSRIAISVVLAGIAALVANVLLASGGSGRDVVTNLLVVATVKVLSMVVLLVLYWISGQNARRRDREDQFFGRLRSLN